MGLLRLVLLIILGVLLYRMWRRRQDKKAAQAKMKPQDQGQMVACAHCGLYLPQQDAVRDGGEYFCSDAHRLAHRGG